MQSSQPPNKTENAEAIPFSARIRPAGERGFAYHGWLKSFHSFSFADYYDKNHMGFSILRVINEDRIEGGSGFATHGHRDMEIISYVISGAVEHKDSMGNSTVIRPGEVQRMTAGIGVKHSEFNHLKAEESHFLQIWLLPRKQGEAPGYAQKSFQEQMTSNDLVLVGSSEGRKGSIEILQDVDLYACKASTAQAPKSTTVNLKQSGRSVYIQVVSGEVQAQASDDPSGKIFILGPGDGWAAQGVSSLSLTWSPQSEFLVFDLPH